MLFVVLILLMLAAAATAAAQIPDATADPDPPPTFSGDPWAPRPVYAPPAPRHPFMTANQRSNIHGDAFQTDTHAWSGPLGRETETLSPATRRRAASAGRSRSTRRTRS